MFIANIGQFDKHANEQTRPIKYAVDFGATSIFFGTKAVSYSFLEVQKNPKEERDILREKMISCPSERRKYEKLVGKFLFKTDVVNMIWVDPSDETDLQGQDVTTEYHTYATGITEGKLCYANTKGFKKIAYKDIYPNIDIE